MKSAGLFDGLTDDSGEDSSELSTGSAYKKAKTPKTPGASRLSKPDHTFSQLMHRLKEMDRHQAAADAREVSQNAAIYLNCCLHARCGLKHHIVVKTLIKYVCNLCMIMCTCRQYIERSRWTRAPKS